MTSPAHAVFIGDGSGNLYDLDVSTNTSTLIGNSGVTMFDIALDPISGTLYGVTGGGSLMSIDTTNASTTLIGSTASVNGLTFDSSGVLYGTGGSSLVSIDTSTGAFSLLGNTGYTSSGDIAFDSSGNLFLSATGGDQLIDITSTLLGGSGSLIGNIGFSGVYGLNFDSFDTLYGFTSAGSTLTIDTTTGAGTAIAMNGIATYGADGVGGVSVPEPSILALLSIGLVGLGFARKKVRT
ncbi:MAG: PEP-CTERM sorting domain-containing protein [Porticoccus sp.]|nr:PEP-CTERM sorting domain-containing protein [Porticoccus sp.]